MSNSKPETVSRSGIDGYIALCNEMLRLAVVSASKYKPGEIEQLAKRLIEADRIELSWPSGKNRVACDYRRAVRSKGDVAWLCGQTSGRIPAAVVAEQCGLDIEVVRASLQRRGILPEPQTQSARSTSHLLREFRDWRATV